MAMNSSRFYKTMVITYIERMLRFYSRDFKQDKILKFFSNNPSSQKSRWDADRQHVNSILQDGDELDYSIDEKNGDLQRAGNLQRDKQEFKGRADPEGRETQCKSDFAVLTQEHNL